MLIVGRFVAGLGAAGIANGSITIVSSCAPIEKRPGEYQHASDSGYQVTFLMIDCALFSSFAWHHNGK